MCFLETHFLHFSQDWYKLAHNNQQKPKPQTLTSDRIKVTMGQNLTINLDQKLSIKMAQISPEPSLTAYIYMAREGADERKLLRCRHTSQSWCPWHVQNYFLKRVGQKVAQDIEGEREWESERQRKNTRIKKLQSQDQTKTAWMSMRTKKGETATEAILDGPIRANRFADSCELPDSRESFQGSWSSRRRKIHPKKSTQNKKVHLNKFIWTIPVGFLTRLTGKQAKVRANFSKKFV